jgi:nicotinamidase-related amidase
MERHKNLLDAERAVLLIIDVQERFREHIFEFSRLTSAIATLAEAAGILGLPVVVTEQYSRGLGSTVSEIADKLPTGTRVIEKMCFSTCGVEDFNQHLLDLKRKQILVCGIETHVCVNQSVHDLLKNGYEVHLATDALGSRSPDNKLIGLAKMYQAGALPSSVEMSLFEMLVESGTETFKAVQKLVK